VCGCGGTARRAHAFHKSRKKQGTSTASVNPSPSGCSRHTAEYPLSLPLLGDYLEGGLGLFDEGIVDDNDTREGLDAEDEPSGNVKDKP
jgi:hypothetical protein